MKIAVAGAGYVGLSIATLLAQNNEVKLVDVIPEKVDKVNARISPIQDDYIEKYFKEKKLNLVATLDGDSVYKDADFVVIAAPTNYDPVKNFFDTHFVEDVIELVESCEWQHHRHKRAISGLSLPKKKMEASLTQDFLKIH